MFRGDRLKSLREEKKLTQTDLAINFNISDSAINRYEKGLRNPDYDLLAKLSSFFNVSVDYLLGISDVRKSELPQNAIIPDEHITVPLLGTIRAGEPLYAEVNVVGYAPVPKFLITSGEYFYLKVVGDSMNLDNILDGGYVLVRRQEEVENGEIAVVLVDGEEATIKRFYKNDGSVTLMPKSNNPVHQPLLIDTKKIPVKVIGKVVWYLNKA